MSFWRGITPRLLFLRFPPSFFVNETLDCKVNTLKMITFVYSINMPKCCFHINRSTSEAKIRDGKSKWRYNTKTAK